MARSHLRFDSGHKTQHLVLALGGEPVDVVRDLSRRSF
jgi:hypothetical protein